MYGKCKWKIVKIPVPHFVVFYNGKDHAPEHYTLRLSDAFEREIDAPEIELVCHVYNINQGNNTELLAKCSTLREYMYFVDLVREYHNKNEFSNLEDAIHQAIEQCIKENVLRDFLIEHRAEVMHVMTLDFTFEHRLELQREAAIEEGRQLGLKDAFSGLIRNKMNNNKSLEQIAVDLDVQVDQIRPIYEEIAKELQK